MHHPHFSLVLTGFQGYVESGEGIKANLAAWEKVSMERGENFKLGMAASVRRGRRRGGEIEET